VRFTLRFSSFLFGSRVVGGAVRRSICRRRQDSEARRFSLVSSKDGPPTEATFDNVTPLTERNATEWSRMIRLFGLTPSVPEPPRTVSTNTRDKAANDPAKWITGPKFLLAVPCASAFHVAVGI
jgi:hypothetical protein